MIAGWPLAVGWIALQEASAAPVETNCELPSRSWAVEASCYLGVYKASRGRRHQNTNIYSDLYSIQKTGRWNHRTD